MVQLLALLATAWMAVASGLSPVATVKSPASVLPADAPAVEHRTYGFVQSLRGNTLVITNRAGKTVVIDGSFAHANVNLFPGRAVIVFGAADAAGRVHATAVWRTFPDAVHWPADR